VIRRLLLIPVLAFAFGFAVATLKGQGGGLLDGVGNLSAPWLLVAFLPGLGSRSAVKGALAGLAATVLALAGFYLAVGLHADYGLHSLRAGLDLAFSANRRYFLAGLVSGPVFGVIGAWWGSRGDRRPALAVGALLLAEPLVIGLISLGHVLGQYGFGWQSAPGVYLAEFAVGAVVLAVGWLLPRRPPRHAA
jgi:Family of unknown function (DUF6518)